jgi:hypothetical protein
MPYRDDRPALEARRDDLQRQVAELSAQTEALRAAVQGREAAERELADLTARLSQMDARRASLLEDVRIASPCSASWDAMTGDDRVRFCGQCQKNVYDLSALSRGEAETLLAEREGSICVRLYRRADGTVLTADCPVGLRRKRVRLTILAAAGAGALAAASVASARAYTWSMRDASSTLGEVAAPEPDIYVNQPFDTPPEPGLLLVYGWDAVPRGRASARWKLYEDGRVTTAADGGAPVALAPTAESIRVAHAVQEMASRLQPASTGAVRRYVSGTAYQRFQLFGTGQQGPTYVERTEIFDLAHRILGMR